jgi:hypothetical protein
VQKAKSRVALSLPTDLLPWEPMQKNENMTRSKGLNVEKIDREVVSTW